MIFPSVKIPYCQFIIIWWLLKLLDGVSSEKRCNAIRSIRKIDILLQTVIFVLDKPNRWFHWTHFIRCLIVFESGWGGFNGMQHSIWKQEGRSYLKITINSRFIDMIWIAYQEATNHPFQKLDLAWHKFSFNDSSDLLKTYAQMRHT